jgi:HEPN domain-containing protein
LEVHQEVPDEIREVIELSDYAVQMRYPGDYYPVSDEEYARAVDLAGRVLDWVCLQIATQEEKEGRSEKREG